MLGRHWTAIVLICVIVTPAAAQERTAVRNGFDVASVSGKTILLMRPSIRVGAQSTGGLFEPNAEWNDQARKNIDRALDKAQERLKNRILLAPESYGDDARLVEDYTALLLVLATTPGPLAANAYREKGKAVTIAGSPPRDWNRLSLSPGKKAETWTLADTAKLN